MLENADAYFTYLDWPCITMSPTERLDTSKVGAGSVFHPIEIADTDSHPMPVAYDPSAVESKICSWLSRMSFMATSMGGKVFLTGSSQIRMRPTAWLRLVHHPRQPFLPA